MVQIWRHLCTSWEQVGRQLDKVDEENLMMGRQITGARARVGL